MASDRPPPSDADKLDRILALLEPVTSAISPTELWEKYCQLGDTPEDLDTEDGRMRNHVLPYRPNGPDGPTLGEMPATSITGLMIGAYYKHRALQISDHTHRPPRTGTINREVAALRHLLNWAVDAKLIPVSQIARIKMRPEHDGVRQTILAEEAFARLMEAAASFLGGLLPAILLCLYESGMRRMEVLRLRWDQIDFETGSVRLPAAITKNKEPRRPRLLARSLAAIQAIARHAESPYVFTRVDEPGKPWSKKKAGQTYHWRYVYDRFEEAVREAGLTGVDGEKVVLHTLRHSFITNAVRRGVREKTVMRMSGHKTRIAFDRYDHADETDVDVAAEILEAGIKRDLAAKRRGPKRADGGAPRPPPDPQRIRKI